MMTMSTELSPKSRATSPSTAVTTPDHMVADEENIWESDGDEILNTAGANRGELLSDLPTIKRQHMTDGYREGLAIGKAQVMQEGFDSGYPIGVQIAARAGVVLGVLEGYLASKSRANSTDSRAVLQKLYDQATQELSCPNLLKDMSDEIIADATGIPPSIDAILSKWEHLVLGTSKNLDP